MLPIMRLYAVLDLPYEDVSSPFAEGEFSAAGRPLGLDSVMVTATVQGTGIKSVCDTVDKIAQIWPSTTDAEVRSFTVVREFFENTYWWPFDGEPVSATTSATGTSDLRRGSLRAIEEVRRRVQSLPARGLPRGFMLDWSSASTEELSALWGEVQPYVSVGAAVGVSIGVRVRV